MLQVKMFLQIHILHVKHSIKLEFTSKFFLLNRIPGQGRSLLEVLRLRRRLEASYRVLGRNHAQVQFIRLLVNCKLYL